MCAHVGWGEAVGSGVGGCLWEGMVFPLSLMHPAPSSFSKGRKW